VTSNGPEQVPNGPGQPSPSATPPPGPRRTAVDLGRLRLADYAVAAGTLLYLIFALIPWYSVDGFDLGSGFSIPGVSVNGFDSGMIVFAFVLLLAATAWALTPAFADVPVPFPRAFVTAGLAALAFLLTLIEWLSDLDIGFSFMAFLTVLAAAAVLAFAVLRLLPDLRGGGAVPGGLAGAAQWANQPAPQFGGGTAGHSPAGATQSPPVSYGQPVPDQPYGGPPVGRPGPPAGTAPATDEPDERPSAS
jgi:hypothetical protein